MLISQREITNEQDVNQPAPREVRRVQEETELCQTFCESLVSI